MQRVSDFVPLDELIVCYQPTPDSTHITVHDLGALWKPEMGGHVTNDPERPIGYISPSLLVHDPILVTICHDCFPQDGSTPNLQLAFMRAYGEVFSHGQEAQ